MQVCSVFACGLTHSWRVLMLQNFLHRSYVSCLHMFLWVWSWFFVTSHRLVRGLQVLVDIRGCDLRSGETSTEPGDNGRRKQQEACINTVQRRGGYWRETASYWELPFLKGLRGNQALVDCILGVKTLSDVQVTSGYLSGVYNTLTREQTQPQADRAFSQWPTICCHGDDINQVSRMPSKWIAAPLHWELSWYGTKIWVRC